MLLLKKQKVNYIIVPYMQEFSMYRNIKLSVQLICFIIWSCSTKKHNEASEIKDSVATEEIESNNLDIREFKELDVPKLNFKGKIMKGLSWVDKNGDNYFIITEGNAKRIDPALQVFGMKLFKKLQIN